MSWGTIFLVIAAIIFFALAIDLIDIRAKGIDFHFLGLVFVCLGLIFGGLPLPISFRRAP